MTLDRGTALQRLSVGDIFHARSSNRASLTCVVTAVDKGVIHARRIHTQDDVQFDRNTGFELGKTHTRIDCVAPLPSEIHTIFVDFDRRYRAAMALVRKGIEVDPREARWTADERCAHEFLKGHIEANPI